MCKGLSHTILSILFRDIADALTNHSYFCKRVHCFAELTCICFRAVPTSSILQQSNSRTEASAVPVFSTIWFFVYGCAAVLGDLNRCVALGDAAPRTKDPCVRLRDDGRCRSDCGFFLIAHDCFEFIFPRICVVCLIIFPNDVCAYV